MVCISSSLGWTARSVARLSPITPTRKSLWPRKLTTFGPRGTCLMCSTHCLGVDQVLCAFRIGNTRSRGHGFYAGPAYYLLRHVRHISCGKGGFLESLKAGFRKRNG